METKIEAKELKLSKIFSSDFMFKIPIYQRNFSWNSDDFNLLFEDIEESMINGQEQYFLGSILLQETKKDSLFEIVDGQQRLTSLTILLAVIRDSIEDEDLKKNIQECIYQKENQLKGIPAVMRITPWKDLNNLFSDYVYEPGGTYKFVEDFNTKISYRDTQDPIYHLYESIITFQTKVNESDSLRDYVVYILNNVYMVYIKTNSFNSAFRLFNVLNSRGVPLSTYDLLKSENLGEITDEGIREDYALALRSIENSIGLKEIEKIIGFIRTIKTKEKAKTNVYEEYKNIFKKGLISKGSDFLDYFQRITEIYSNKVLEPNLNVSHESKNEYKLIIDLMNRFIPFADWIPPLLEFYDKFESDDDLLNFVLKLEKKALIEWMAGFSPTERITSLNKIIKLIEDSPTPEHVIENLLYYKTDDGRGKKSRTLNFKKQYEIESIITNKLNDNQFYSIYGGKLSKYILLRVDMTLWDLEVFPGYPGMVTVEHILPQTPSPKSKWMKNFNDAEREEWTNKLGNLVLLSGRKNSQARNYEFEKKKDIYFKKKSTPFQITQKLKECDDWNMKNLEERHEKLIKRVKTLLL